MSGTITGESPGWVAGYVPSSAEWNQWFSRKMDIDNAEFVGGPFLPMSGGQMTGALLLAPGTPASPAQAVSKSYVDSLTFVAGPFMPQSGGTFTGPVIHTSTLTLMGNPANPLDAAPKQYVDAVNSVANNALSLANAAVRRAGDTMTGLLVLSADPVNVLGASTKQYTDTKLALAGGQITGNLGVAGQTVVGGGLYSYTTFFANSFNGYEWSFTVDGNGNKYQTFRSGWYNMWNASNGGRVWVGPGGSLMTLDGSGNLTVPTAISSASITGNTVSSNGNMFAAATVSAAALSLGPWIFYNNGNQVQQHTTGWYDEWVTTNGTRNWVGGNVNQMTLDPAGNLNVHGNVGGFQVNSTTAVVANTGVFAQAGAMFFGQSGTARLLQFSANWYLAWDTTNGTLQWVGDMAPVQGFWFWRTSDRMCYNGLGFVGGVGNYQNLSDERAKAAIEPASCGLAEVMRIEPIEFDRIFNDGRDAPREIGFSAQQLKEVLPLAVRPMGVLLTDGSGGLESDEPTLGVGIEPVVAALVNGMKELSARLAALEGGSFFP